MLVKLRRLLLLLVSLVLIIIFILWYMLMQPVMGSINKVTNIETFSPLELENTVKTLVEDFFPRNGANPQNMKRCAEYIKAEFSKNNQRASYQRYVIDQKTYYNIIVSFGPEDGERIIVGAHYDSAGELPGADDNASGVAGLIALAKKLAKLKSNQLTTRIDLVAYALEEPPYFKTDQMGSAWHAFKMHEEKVAVKLMISLEMLGFYSDRDDSQQYPIPVLDLLYPTKGNYIAIIGLFNQGGITRKAKTLMQAATSMDVYSINAPRIIPGIDFSDHLNYWNEGYPAIMITDTAFFRNHAYHTEDDVPDRLNYEKMADVLSGVLNMVTQF